MATLISFLGAGVYSETTYVYGGQRHTSCYMADAAARFFKPQRILVFTTVEAERAHFAALCERLADFMSPTQVPIPSDQHEADQWTIFARVAEQIRPGEELIFDITSGFRSIPVLALLIAAYVRVVRRSDVRSMVYGAFDARNRETNETPVFDLTPLVALLNWTTATDAFLTYGRADALQALVDPRRQANQTGASVAHQLAARLGALTAALQTSRPAEVMQTAEGLPEALDAFKAATDLDARASPLGLLLATIEGEYSGMGHPQPRERSLAREVVIKQLEIIEWYAAKGLYVQAFTLTREWLVSVALAADSTCDLYNEYDRRLAEAAVNGYNRTSERPPRDVPPAVLAAGRLAPMRDLWGRCSKLRNDIAHAGMRHRPNSAEVVEREVRQVCAELRPTLRSLGYPV